MSTTSKSPRKVALVALAVARDALPAYAHRFSPQKFTQHQLFACLALKAFFKTDYRGVATMLADMPGLRNAIGLQFVPHFTTLQKAARRLLISVPANRLLDATLRITTRRSGRVPLAAVDSSGLESHHVSRYFVCRRSRVPELWQKTTYIRFPKLGIVCDCDNHMILSTLLTRGPSPDVNQLERTLCPATRRVTITTLLADAGYESESNHVFCREHLGIESIIPTTQRGRPRKDGGPRRTSGYYRLQMAARFDKAKYGQRWQVETVFSMIKRNLGSSLRGRSYWSQCRDMMLLALVHNITILRQSIAFLQSIPDPFNLTPLIPLIPMSFLPLVSVLLVFGSTACPGPPPPRRSLPGGHDVWGTSQVFRQSCLFTPADKSKLPGSSRWVCAQGGEQT